MRNALLVLALFVSPAAAQIPEDSLLNRVMDGWLSCMHERFYGARTLDYERDEAFQVASLACQEHEANLTTAIEMYLNEAPGATPEQSRMLAVAQMQKMRDRGRRRLVLGQFD